MSGSAVERLDEAEAAAELERLAREIAHHDRLYHTLDAPEISDADYDLLRHRNLEIEARFPGLVRADSPSKRVGGAPETGFAKVRHLVPMLSLDNAFGGAEFSEFCARARRFLGLAVGEKLACVGEPKIDGLSINLTYERGRFVRGATRGWDRGRGRYRQSADDQDGAGAIAWEGAGADRDLRRSVHDEGGFFRAERGAGGGGAPAVCQSAECGGGSLRQLDPKITASRPLSLFAYAMGEGE